MIQLELEIAIRDQHEALYARHVDARTFPSIDPATVELETMAGIIQGLGYFIFRSIIIQLGEHPEFVQLAKDIQMGNAPKDAPPPNGQHIVDEMLRRMGFNMQDPPADPNDPNEKGDDDGDAPDTP